ncbi:MAG: MBL fold metallo-hydrolase [Candidatus Sericytochromatia bacterium]|nr:MBL fold metallo-hydrolase [Candidatus Sericytochromatia bacterium]
MQLGSLTIDWVAAGDFKLDGGAMFGPVPKPLWARKIEADDRNRIWLGTNCILVTGPFGRALVDVGLGNKLGEKQRDIYAMEPAETLLASLAARGLAPADIDHVVLSHCDFDHLGGATWRDADGTLRPTFPNATVHIHPMEWEDLTHPNARAKGTYLRENWEPLEAAGRVRLIPDDGAIVPGIGVHHTGGHTRGHVVVAIESQAERAVYMGDLMPTRHHLNPLWVMAYDNFPLTSIEQRSAWLGRIAAEGWWLLFYHDMALGAARLTAGGELGDTVPLPPRAAERAP